MKQFIFDSLHQWKVCFLAGLGKAGWGIWRILTCIIGGVISILIFCGKEIEAFCRREPIAAMIVSVTIVALTAGWIMTFVHGRVAVKTAEYQRDSIGYKLDKYMQAYDSTSTIVIDNDTIQ